MVQASNLVVLADRGAMDVDAALGHILKTDEDELAAQQANELEKVRRGDFAPEALVKQFQAHFPVKSTREEGYVQSRDFLSARGDVFKPLVFLADGPRSRRWLEKNRRRLKELQVMIVVVKAESQQGIFKLTQIYGSPVKVMSDSDALLDKFDVPALPVLITENGVYQ
ncbi:DUF2859 domain-containing protein [Vibrio vulnificus]